MMFSLSPLKNTSDRPRWHQDGPKTAPRRPKTAPRPPQDGPRRPQDGPKRPQDAPRAAPGASWTPLGPPRPPGTPSGHPPGPPRALENANVGTIWWSNWVRFGVYSRPPRTPRKCKCWNDLGVKLCPVWGLFGLWFLSKFASPNCVRYPPLTNPQVRVSS